MNGYKDIDGINKIYDSNPNVQHALHISYYCDKNQYNIASIVLFIIVMIWGKIRIWKPEKYRRQGNLL